MISQGHLFFGEKATVVTNEDCCVWQSEEQLPKHSTLRVQNNDD